MALSGTINGTTNNDNIVSKIIWSATQSISGNYSTVTATLYYSRTNTGYTTYGEGDFSITINGSTKAVTKTVTITYNSNTLAISHAVQVPHLNNGTRSVLISGSGGIPGTSFTTTSCSQTVTLDTIPRATTPTLSASTADMGTSITIYTNRASTDFTHTLTYSFGNASGTIGTGVATQKTWAIPIDLADQIPNAVSGTVTVTCKTYSGGTLIGTKTVTFKATVPSSVVPVINTVSIAEAVAGIASKFSGYVQNKSKLNVNVTSIGAYSSTIKVTETRILGISYWGSAVTSGLLTSSGTVSVACIVTDSRGRQASVVSNITVLPYANPSIAVFNAHRCDNLGNLNDEGTSILANINFTVAAVNNLNDNAYKIEYKQTGTETWNTLTTGNAYSYNSAYTNLNGLFSADYPYSVRLTITDYFGSVTSIVDVPTAFTLIDLNASGKGMAFGQVSSEDGVVFGMESKFKTFQSIYAPTNDAADGAFVKLRRLNGSLLAFLATSDNGTGLNLHLYNGTSWSGMVKIYENGDVYTSGKNINESVTAPTLQNSWANYGGTYAPAGYWKDKNGVVHIRGLIKDGTVTDGTVLFTLPSGYRPAYREVFTVHAASGPARVDVFTDGTVVANSGASATFTSLSGISFRAEN